VSESSDEVRKAMETLGKGSPWSPDTKASEFLDSLFAVFYGKLGLPNLMRKTDYHVLARFVPGDQVDPEVTEVLNGILDASRHANPAREKDVE
jgi:hypothetical protein